LLVDWLVEGQKRQATSKQQKHSNERIKLQNVKFDQGTSVANKIVAFEMFLRLRNSADWLAGCVLSTAHKNM